MSVKKTPSCALPNTDTFWGSAECDKFNILKIILGHYIVSINITDELLSVIFKAV